MKWTDEYKGRHPSIWRWHDLLEGEGTETDSLLGYIREAPGANEFIADINEAATVSKKFDNLEDAKNYIVAHYVTKKLEGT